MNVVQADAKAMHVYDAYNFAENFNFVYTALQSTIVISKPLQLNFAIAVEMIILQVVQ